ncbi:uncharacterized protein E0L32_006930 [Thyridium curvatum]|uniref:Uncharacterized protein n=1 Tax=Thyridium curvatum TaxID=1093900 RepID=A0A507AX47_9PEZI|nr:uncharacterized protein E0L32_006930 [Thyridium curvatum]TPX12283.1 hypothetical protein E0L32_006930 [Thyridium curvatum]
MRSNKMRSGLVAALLSCGVAAAPPNCCTKTIHRDVVVVGGGAAGAHAGVWLRDHGKSVLLIEKNDRLGGHTADYTDPVTGKVINVGVQAWMQYKDAFDFPKRMNVSTSGSMQFATLNYHYVDMKTGKPVEGWVSPGPDTLYPALQRYLTALEKYEDMVLPGFFNFPKKGADIPEDLLMPFGEFALKYNMSAAVPQIWDSTAQGLADTMHVPALWVFQASGVPMVRALLGQGAAAVPASGPLFELFEAVAKFLGGDVLYSSTVVSASRSPGKVTLRVRSGSGELTCVQAKRLVVAMEPTPENMAPFALDDAERAVFDKIEYSTVYAGILRHPSLKSGQAYTNRSPLPGSTNYTVFPTAAQLGRMDWVGGTEDLFQFTAVGTEADTEESMKALIARSIDNLIEAGTLARPEGGRGLTFSIFANHGKMHARVSADELRAGFVQQQYALQGRRSTYYTGAAFSAGFSTVLWVYNDVLLPKVIEGI